MSRESGAAAASAASEPRYVYQPTAAADASPFVFTPSENPSLIEGVLLSILNPGVNRQTMLVLNGVLAALTLMIALLLATVNTTQYPTIRFQLIIFLAITVSLLLSVNWMVCRYGEGLNDEGAEEEEEEEAEEEKEEVAKPAAAKGKARITAASKPAAAPAPAPSDAEPLRPKVAAAARAAAAAAAAERAALAATKAAAAAIAASAALAAEEAAEEAAEAAAAAGIDDEAEEEGEEETPVAAESVLSQRANKKKSRKVQD